MNLILRNCDSEGRSTNGFQWNLTIGGVTEAPDWQPTEECGNGLHGFLWGEGYGSLAGWRYALWLVCEIGDYIDLDGKVKFRRATTLFVGSLQEAAKYLYDKMLALGLVDKKIIGLSGDCAFAGDYANLRGEGQRSQTSGHWSTQTAMDRSTQTAGYGSTQTSGHWSTQTAMDRSTQTSGYGSTQTSGHWSTQTAMDRSTQTTGDGSTQTAGDESTQTTGDGSTQTAGDGSNHKIGNRCYVTTGAGSVIIHRWYDKGLKVKTFVIETEQAGKKFYYENGEQLSK